MIDSHSGSDQPERDREGSGSSSGSGVPFASEDGGQASSKLGAVMADYHQVKLDPTARLSPYCSIVGDVEVGPEVSVFAGSHIRGDGSPIRIGAGTNIQENCCFHVSGGYALSIGENVTVGHGAIVHGCTVEDNVLIGMGSIVMDGARIASNSLVAAGAIVTEGKEFPPGSLIMGVPGRAVRTLSEEEIALMITLAGKDYVTESASMVANGLLEHPPAEARIWPVADV